MTHSNESSSLPLPNTESNQHSISHTSGSTSNQLPISHNSGSMSHPPARHWSSSMTSLKSQIQQKLEIKKIQKNRRNKIEKSLDQLVTHHQVTHDKY